MLPILAGKGVLALGVVKKHWGKMIALIFVIAWGFITIGLYDDTQELTMALGSADSAVSVCIAQRANMDNVLLLLKADIALIQADNEKYKEGIAEAEIVIENLQEAVPVIISEIDAEVFEESCEGSMDWMLKKALEQ